jgi:hypothetical protein
MSIIFKPPISKLPIIEFLLTLSGLPSYMNLKHLLSISFLYLSGTTHALATKVNIGMTNAFSGLLMNKNKTGGIWVGKLKHSKDEIEGIKWYEKPIKTFNCINRGKRTVNSRLI